MKIAAIIGASIVVILAGVILLGTFRRMIREYFSPKETFLRWWHRKLP